MDIFPTEIQHIIVTYQRDMELLEQQPKPSILQYCNPTQICCYDRFVTERLLELLYSRLSLFEVKKCIKCLLRIPANIFMDYNTACEIFQERCLLWGMKPDDANSDLWGDTLPTVLNEFLQNGNLSELYHHVNRCLSRDYMFNLRLTEAW